jgi:dihydroflavonol-4-reductase
MYDVLVLGATGFIGGQIAKQALEVGWQVHGFRRDPSLVGQLDGLNINWIDGDLDDYPSLVHAMQGKEYVFHAAASYPGNGDPDQVSEIVDYSSDQMRKILRAMRETRIKRLIYTSSLTTIGLPAPGEDRLADESDHYQLGTLPDNSYYESKAAMEKIALEASGVGYDIVILNPTLVFGPGDIHLSTGEILLLIAGGKAFAVPPGEINIIDVRDAAEAHINAARIGKTGERYILGGSNYSITEAAKIITGIAGVNPPRMELPTWLIDLYIQLGDTLPFIPHPHAHVRAYHHWQGYNTSKARKELELKSRFLEETVRDSLSWYSARGVI